MSLVVLVNRAKRLSWPLVLFLPAGCGPATVKPVLPAAIAPVRPAVVKAGEKPYLIARVGLNRLILLEAAAGSCLQVGSEGPLLEYSTTPSCLIRQGVSVPRRSRVGIEACEPHEQIGQLIGGDFALEGGQVRRHVGRRVVGGRTRRRSRPRRCQRARATVMVAS